MNENDKHFIKRYEELLDKGYCNCNEMNCIDNNSPRRILNIVNSLQSKIDKIIKLCETEKKYTYDNVRRDEKTGKLIHENKIELDVINKSKILDVLKEDKKWQN